MRFSLNISYLFLKITVISTLLCHCTKKSVSTHTPTPRIEGSIVAELERQAHSPTPTVAQVSPYDEALVFHSYRVKRVLAGDLPDETIQVGHWAIVNGKAQDIESKIGQTIQLEMLPIARVPGAIDLFHANELNDLYSPQYIEVHPPDQPIVSSFRYQYGGPISKQMRLYWELRDQLRLIALGNSRTSVGVATEAFFQPQNKLTPLTLNLAPPGSNLELQQLLVTDYLQDLPRLEWVLWGLSPRYFNKHRPPNARLNTFVESHGYRYDRQQARDDKMGRAKNTDKSLSLIAKLNLPTATSYGATIRSDVKPLNPKNHHDAELLKKAFTRVRFEWDEEQWSRFQKVIHTMHQRGLRILLFIPPTHPFCTEYQASDPDGTGPEHHSLVVKKLTELDHKLDRVWFEDFHKAGHHSFPPEDFSDVGHLDRSGALKLTNSLVNIVQSVR
jgi:hypothetical protein